MDNVSYSLGPDFFHGPLIYMPSLVFICPQAIWHPWTQPMTQHLYLGPSSLQYKWHFMWFTIFLSLSTSRSNYCNWNLFGLLSFNKIWFFVLKIFKILLILFSLFYFLCKYEIWYYKSYWYVYKIFTTPRW